MARPAVDFRARRDGAARLARLAVLSSRVRLLFAVLGLVLGIGVVTAPLAAAHADLVSTDPAAGAHVGSLPSNLTFRFTEAVSVSATSVAVTDASGRTAVMHPVPATLGNTALRVTLPRSVAAGAARVTWRAVAADDGHVTSGGFDLTIAAPAAPTSQAVPAAAVTPAVDTAGVQGAFAAVRMLSYLAIAVLCGGLVFLAFLWPAGAGLARPRQLLLAAWLVGLLTSVLGLGLEGATILQKPLAAALAPAVMGKAVTLQFGRVWAGKALLFVVAAPVLWALRIQGPAAARSTAWRVAAAFVCLALVRTPGLIAHTNHAPHPDLGSVADLIHLAGVSVWIGGLVMLAAVVLPRRDPDELRSVVPAFSKAAMISVTGIVAGGAFLAWQLVGSLHGLVHTSFGHVLLLKLIAFALIMAAARASRRWVAGRLDLAIVLGGDSTTVRPFVVSVAAEAALAVVVLVLASNLVNTNPVR